MGLHDACMCLKWINENIIYFGGDNSKITIFGESAGSAIVDFMLMSPLTKGLFSKAIMQSGNSLSPWAFTTNPTEKVRDLVKQIGIDCDVNSDMTQIIEILKELNPYIIAAQRMDFTEWKEQPLVHFAPSIESGDHTLTPPFLTESPWEIIKSNKFSSQVPIMMGINKEEGAYRAIPLLQNPARLKALNANWLEDAHQYMLYNDKTIFPNHSEFASSVRKFYFGDMPINFDTRGRLIDMFSDALFIHSTKTTALYHSNFHTPENPIFLYIFDYQGEFSYLNSFGIFENYGCTHADELQYILNQGIFYSNIMRGTEDDYMIGKVSSMWANFAKYGVPSQTWEPLELVEGPTPPSSRPLKYYRISKGDTDSIIEEPFVGRMSFWESLNLNI